MENCTEQPGETNGELLVSQCGREECKPGHQFGPAVRRCFLIHYISAGRGEFILQGRSHPVRAGQGFIIFPGDVTTYRASTREPWHYRWIGYDGRQAALITKQAGLRRDEPVFDAPHIQGIEGILDAVYEDIATLRLGGVSAVGGLLRFLARIGQEQSLPDEQPIHSQAAQYFDKAVWYIEGNLTRPLRVSDVASFVGLCRSQLFRVFQTVAGCAPQEWIQLARLKRAETLLLDRSLSFTEVALSVGYTSAAQMAAAMKKLRSLSPSEYRKHYQVF